MSKERNIALLTDSTCDLSDEVLSQNGIDLLCFKIALDGKGYVERQDFTPEQFCTLLRNAKELPKTSQITEYEFLDRFEVYEKAGKEGVIYVSINATGSGTNAAAHAAAEEFHRNHPDSGMRIRIVDSRMYSIAQGQPIVEAAALLDAGKGMDEVVAFLEDRYGRMEILLVAYTLKWIRKSGRISAAAAITGDLLGIHPIFSLNDGISHVLKKVRGEHLAASAMAKTMQSRIIPGKPYYLMASEEKYFEEYKKTCEAIMGYPPAGLGILGAAVLSNTGPDAVGLVYEGENRGKRTEQ
ncbi:MAG: DegV family protein [Clostridia bacterium]|nr:DegV family protein [Clostridia bacterium]